MSFGSSSSTSGAFSFGSAASPFGSNTGASPFGSSTTTTTSNSFSFGGSSKTSTAASSSQAQSTTSAFVLYIMCKKKPVTSHESLSIKTNVVEYPLVDIYVATYVFNHRRIIGKGRLGTVYATVIPTRGDLVALKRIHPRLVLSNVGFRFSSILKTLSLAQHTNINPIFGYSQAPGERIIVMEAQGMANLDFYLHENYNGN
ncbi:hypothetical protein ACFE04_030375 [Oxalis oulophora]